MTQFSYQGYNPPFSSENEFVRTIVGENSVFISYIETE